MFFNDAKISQIELSLDLIVNYLDFEENYILKI